MTENSKAQAGSKAKGVAIAIAAVVVVALVGCGVAYAVHQQQEKEKYDARYAEVEALYNDWVAKDGEVVVATEPADGQPVDRASLLEQFGMLTGYLDGISGDVENGAFLLYDGTQFDVSELTSGIASKLGLIRGWFAADYEARIQANMLADDASIESTTRERVQAIVDALDALRSDMGAEAAIWAGDTDEDSEYATMLSRIEAVSVRGSSLLEQFAERERQEAEAAAAAAAGAGSTGGRNGGGSSSGSGGDSWSTPTTYWWKTVDIIDDGNGNKNTSEKSGTTTNIEDLKNPQ